MDHEGVINMKHYETWENDLDHIIYLEPTNTRTAPFYLETDEHFTLKQITIAFDGLPNLEKLFFIHGLIFLQKGDFVFSRINIASMAKVPDFPIWHFKYEKPITFYNWSGFSVRICAPFMKGEVKIVLSGDHVRPVD